MDDQYFYIDSYPEDNNKQKINNEISPIENKSLENINNLNELIGLELKKEKTEEKIKKDNYIKDKKVLKKFK